MSDPNTKHRHHQFMMMGGGVAVLLALVAAGMFLFDDSDAPTAVTRKPQTVQIAQPGSVSDKDAWRAQQAQKEKSNEVLIGELRGVLKQQAEETKKVAKELEDFKKSKPLGPGVDERVLNTPLPTTQSTTSTANASASAGITATPGGAGQNPAGQRALTPPTLYNKPGQPPALLNQPLNAVVPPQKREVEMIQFNRIGAKNGSGVNGESAVLGFPVNEKARQYSQVKDSINGENEFLAAGTFIRVAMLNGIDAPTGGQAQGNPLPVAFHVLDVANLPNKYRLDVRDCRIIGAAWGDLSSERTMVRLETMSCILGDGDTVEMQIKGQAMGEDGKAGLRGRLVSKQGAMLANALFGGALSGIGKAFQQSATTTNTSAFGTTSTIDPSQVGRAALGGGVGTAGNMLAEYYLKAADKLFPVLETDGGRVVELLVTKGVVYQGKNKLNTNYRALLSRSATNRDDSDD